MNKRFQASSVALALLLALCASIGAQSNERLMATRAAATTTTAARPMTSSAALASLPASDIVIYVDAQRLMNDTLPNFLGGDSALLARVNARLERFQKETGIDSRSLESLAIGLRFPAGSARGEMKFVTIARGSFVAADLIEAGFAAAKRKENVSREEQVYEGKKIFVLTSARDRAAAEAGDASTAKTQPHRMAVAELDANTIAVGDLESVRAALNPSLARVDQGLVDLATRNPNAFASFAGNIPPGVARGFGFGNSKADKLTASIRQIYGSVSTVGTEAQTVLAARTENAEQAQDLAQAIRGLKLLGKFGIGGHSGMGKTQAEALSNLINELSVTSEANQVEIKLSVAQSEITPLMRNF